MYRTPTLEYSPFSYVLAPIDGSETSLNAGRMAIQIAATHNIPLTFLYVINSSAVENIAASTGRSVDAVQAEMQAKARGYLDYLLRLAYNRGVRADASVRYGTPHREITEMARERGADLIVIGKASGAGTQRLARIGSVAEHVLEYAPCPVLVVRYVPRRWSEP